KNVAAGPGRSIFQVVHTRGVRGANQAPIWESSPPASSPRDVQEGRPTVEHCSEATQQAARTELAPNQSHVPQDIALCDNPAHCSSCLPGLRHRSEPTFGFGRAMSKAIGMPGDPT